MQMFLFMTGVSPVLLSFPVERAVFLREAGSEMYGILPYYLGKQIVELPLIVVMPTLYSLIIYWTVGLNDTEPYHFWVFLILAILHHAAGNSVGLFGGCIFPDTRVAQSLLPMLVIPFMLFAGFFANRDTFSPWISWIEYISPMKYTMEAFVTNEYDGLGYENPDPVVDMLHYDLGVPFCMSALFAIFFVLRFISYFALKVLMNTLQ